VSRILHRFERTLLAAGLIGLNIWIWSNFRTAVSQRQSIREMERRIDAREHTPRPLPKPASGDLLGNLEVPRLRLQAAVREGDNASTLDVALGHIPGTAFPGEKGNVGVAGHRDTLFRGLKNIAKDDLIRFQTVDATYSYQVESTTIVKPENVGVLDPGKQPEITLVTCYPFNYVGSAPKRFIVKARQVQDVAVAEPAPAIEPAAVKVKKSAPVAAGRRRHSR